MCLKSEMCSDAVSLPSKSGGTREEQTLHLHKLIVWGGAALEMTQRTPRLKLKKAKVIAGEKKVIGISMWYILAKPAKSF